MDVVKIVNIIQKHAGNRRVYVVGGYLRDLLLKRQTNDIDFVVTGSAGTFARAIANVMKGTFVLLDKENHIYRVVIKSGKDGNAITIDFSKLRGAGIVEDLAQRDFTINAMAYPCSGKFIFLTKNIIDPFKGINDLHKKVIRGVSKRIFKDDPLRLMRAYRFQAELGFTIDRKTQTLIKNNAKLIKRSAYERIHDELLKILDADHAADIIAKIDHQNILEHIIPEIKRMKRSARKFYFHPEGLWQHLKESLYALENILADIDTYAGKYRESVMEHIDNRKALLKLAVLLHDAGKPDTVKVIDGRTRFFGHEKAGEDRAKVILKRLKMSRKNIQVIQKLIHNHMRPSNLSKVRVLTQKAMYRYFRDIGDESLDLLLLSLADISSYLPPFSARKRGRATYKERKLHTIFVQRMIQAYFTFHKQIDSKKIINGHMLMKALKIKPGPLVGKILSAVEEQQALGRIHTKKDALKFSRKYLRY